MGNPDHAGWGNERPEVGRWRGLFKIEGEVPEAGVARRSEKEVGSLNFPCPARCPMNKQLVFRKDMPFEQKEPKSWNFASCTTALYSPVERIKCDPSAIEKRVLI